MKALLLRIRHGWSLVIAGAICVGGGTAAFNFLPRAKVIAVLLIGAGTVIFMIQMLVLAIDFHQFLGERNRFR